MNWRATYQVPIEVPRKGVLSRFFVARGASNNSSGRPMAEKLANELIAAANGDNAIKKKEDTHRMADANKAFTHFR